MSRLTRTKQFRDRVEHEWTKKYWSFIQENLDKDWNWSWISKNPNITMDIIRDNPDKPWNWRLIHVNQFPKEKESFIEDAYKKYLAAYKIQQWWKHITMSPHYAIGRKFINRNYDELFVKV